MIKELSEKRARLHEENVAILQKAAKDGRDVLNADEQTEWQSRDDAIEALTRNIEMHAKTKAVEERLATVDTRVTQPSLPETRATRAVQNFRNGQDDLEMALRGWFIAGTDKPLTDAHKDAANRVGIDLRNRMLSFDLGTRAPKTLREAREMEVRAQSTLTTAAGLATVPDEMMRSLEQALLWYGGMRQASTIIRTESGAAMPIPTVNDTGQKGVILDQNTQVANQDVTFGQVVLGAFKYSSKQILVSVELMQDAGFNIAQFLGQALGERIGRIQNEHFTTGAGTTLPWGVVTRAISGLAPTGTAAAEFTHAHLVQTEHSVDIGYRRQGASWMMNDAVVARFKQIVDLNGRPIWQPGNASIQEAQPMTLLGYPVIINNDMSTAHTTTTRAVLFGDFSKYYIRDVRGVTLLRLDERYADFHQVAFLAFARADGDLINAGSNPIKFLAYTT